MSRVDIWRASIASRGDGKCKGPETGARLARSGKSKGQEWLELHGRGGEVRLPRAWWERGRASLLL